MGYSYDARTGRLCCDSCGIDGGVRRVRCPFGWCPADALCAECRVKYASRTTKETHRANGCEASSDRFHAEEAEKVRLLEAGELVRCAVAVWN